ncbi:MAG: 16S rRNA (guanine(966)-N(2))-methyltransferase RsmD [Alphaproteobacteria bacterium]|nr:MAG: 16S rRNA (guanine(966)-N(2))-methyltransferase RsmD [Alphaproteobacteria bacterium]
MRIIAGKLRGRRLESPAGRAIRPTSDRLRETLFNFLAHRPQQPLAGARVADLFAGTGALGFEALSRGAHSVCFVEHSHAARRLLHANAEQLGVRAQCHVLARDACRLPWAAQAFDLIFIDPPYRRGLAGRALASARASGWIGPKTWVVIERALGDASEAVAWPGVAETRAQGDSELVILHPTGNGWESSL